MNYLQFLSYKNKMLVEQPNLINLAENNLYERLSCLVPRNLNYPKVYRCHVAEKICRQFNLSKNSINKITITRGVRDSLDTLFQLHDNWIIPEDQYPWYQQNLREKNKSFIEYPTLGREDMFDNLPDGNLLITFPIKLFSYKNSTFDRVIQNFYNKLYSFLSNNRNNHLYVDNVYNFNFDYNQILINRLLTLHENITILYSFSKSLLLPKHCGFIFSNTSYKQEFANKLINDNELSLIDSLLDDGNLTRNAIRDVLYFKKSRLKLLNNWLIQNKKPSVGEDIDSYFNENSYLFYSKTSHEEYLNHNILTIPESVFGGKGNGSIVSSL